MRPTGLRWLVALLALGMLHAPLPAQDGGGEESTTDENATGDAEAESTESEPGPKPYSPEQITDLVGPIALYPDDLLAHVLAATTFPDQIEAAYKLSRKSRNAEPDPEWDASVQALLPFKRALKRLAKDDEWRAALGLALDFQYEDVLEEVQAFRKRVIDAGNLKSTSRMTVIIEEDGTIRLEQTDPKKMYVPSYGVDRVQEDLTAQASITYGSYYSTRYWTPYYHCWWRRRVIIIHAGHWRRRPVHYSRSNMTANLPPKNVPVWHPGRSGARPTTRTAAAGGARRAPTQPRFVSGYRPPRATTRPATNYRPGSRSAGAKSSSVYPRGGASRSTGVQRRPSSSRSRTPGRAGTSRSRSTNRAYSSSSRSRSHSSRSRSVYRGSSGSRARSYSSRGAASRGSRGGGARGGGGRGGGGRR